MGSNFNSLKVKYFFINFFGKFIFLLRISYLLCLARSFLCVLSLFLLNLKESSLIGSFFQVEVLLIPVTAGRLISVVTHLKTSELGSF